MSNEEYEFKRVSEDQLHIIQSLYQRCFGTYVLLEFLQKKYDTSVFGKRDIGFIAYHKSTGDPAAYYGVFPVTVNVNGKIVLVCQSGDTMTAPEHRKKGLFVRLAHKTYELAAEVGIQFVFGFPNSFSHRGLEKLGWSFFGNMMNFKVNTRALPIALISKKTGLFQGIYKSYVSYILQKHQAIKEEKSDGKMALASNCNVEQSADFFNYKKYNSSFIIDISGFKIWLKVDTTLQIGSVAYFESGREKELIGSLRKLARKLGCNKIVFSLSENHWLAQRLKKTLPAQEGLAIGFLNFNKDSRFPCDKFTFSKADFDTF